MHSHHLLITPFLINAAHRIIDYVCLGFFTLEYLIRLATAPDTWAFVKDPWCVGVCLERGVHGWVSGFISSWF